MRVALDVSIQGGSHPTGVERAQATLLSALLVAPVEHEYLLLTPGRVPAPLRDSPRVTSLEGRGGRTWLWRQTTVPALLRRFSPDVYHSPVAALPCSAPCPRVATIHELPWAGGDRRLGQRSLRHRLAVALAVATAARLVCVSARTAAELVALHPRAAERVRVLPHGLDPRFSPGAAPQPDAPFLLAVGRLRGKKNLSTLLEAFARLLATGSSPVARLLLVGPDGDATAALRRRAAEPDLAGRVELAGFVDDARLLQLYRQATAVVVPSHLEGFGLPVLEAMACGTPVVASRQGAAAEVAADAVLPFDADSADELVAALRRLGDAASVAALVARGSAHARRWSAAAAAEAVLRLYAELL